MLTSVYLLMGQTAPEPCGEVKGQPRLYAGCQNHQPFCNPSINAILRKCNILSKIARKMLCIVAGEIGKRAERARLAMPVPIRVTDLALELGERMGATVIRQTVDNWLRGKANPPGRYLPHLAEILDTTVEFLKDGDGPTRMAAIKGVSVKLYGPVSAGRGNSSQALQEYLEDMPPQFGREDYGAMIVDGDSMLPLLEPGDICFFRDWASPKLRHVFAAELPDGEWVVKQLVFDGQQLVLRSLYGEYGDCTEFRLAGYLVGIVRDIGTERNIRIKPEGIVP